MSILVDLPPPFCDCLLYFVKWSERERQRQLQLQPQTRRRPTPVRQGKGRTTRHGESSTGGESDGDDDRLFAAVLSSDEGEEGEQQRPVDGTLCVLEALVPPKVKAVGSIRVHQGRNSDDDDSTGWQSLSLCRTTILGRSLRSPYPVQVALLSLARDDGEVATTFVIPPDSRPTTIRATFFLPDTRGSSSSSVSLSLPSLTLVTPIALFFGDVADKRTISGWTRDEDKAKASAKAKAKAKDKDKGRTRSGKAGGCDDVRCGLPWPLATLFPSLDRTPPPLALGTSEMVNLGQCDEPVAPALALSPTDPAPASGVIGLPSVATVSALPARPAPHRPPPASLSLCASSRHVAYLASLLPVSLARPLGLSPPAPPASLLHPAVAAWLANLAECDDSSLALSLTPPSISLALILLLSLPQPTAATTRLISRILRLSLNRGRGGQGVVPLLECCRGHATGPSPSRCYCQALGHSAGLLCAGALHQVRLGRRSEGAELVSRAGKVDPLHPLSLSLSAALAEEQSVSLAFARLALAVSPTSSHVIGELSLVLARSGGERHESDSDHDDRHEADGEFVLRLAVAAEERERERERTSALERRRVHLVEQAWRREAEAAAAKGKQGGPQHRTSRYSSANALARWSSFRYPTSSAPRLGRWASVYTSSMHKAAARGQASPLVRSRRALPPPPPPPHLVLSPSLDPPSMASLVTQLSDSLPSFLHPTTAERTLLWTWGCTLWPLVGPDGKGAVEGPGDRERAEQAAVDAAVQEVTAIVEPLLREQQVPSDEAGAKLLHALASRRATRTALLSVLTSLRGNRTLQPGPFLFLSTAVSVALDAATQDKGDKGKPAASRSTTQHSLAFDLVHVASSFSLTAHAVVDERVVQAFAEGDSWTTGEVEAASDAEQPADERSEVTSVLRAADANLASFFDRLSVLSPSLTLPLKRDLRVIATQGAGSDDDDDDDEEEEEEEHEDEGGDDVDSWEVDEEVARATAGAGDESQAAAADAGPAASSREKDNVPTLPPRPASAPVPTVESPAVSWRRTSAAVSWRKTSAAQLLSESHPIRLSDPEREVSRARVGGPTAPPAITVATLLRVRHGDIWSNSDFWESTLLSLVRGAADRGGRVERTAVEGLLSSLALTMLSVSLSLHAVTAFVAKQVTVFSLSTVWAREMYVTLGAVAVRRACDDAVGVIYGHLG